eukprot:Lithocolla_globosa_v1_NODE_1181_length_2804_cov_32.701346.p1 type:complete len:281 gc:universal NODE_1181_length_2804_cov_32.701346:2739-1897(-)
MNQTTTSEDDRSLLFLILDVDVARVQGTDIKLFEPILVFVNAFLSLRYDNLLVVIGCNSRHSKVLYPLSQEPSFVRATIEDEQHPGKYEFFDRINKQIVIGIKSLLTDEVAGQSTRLSAALSQALCYANRVKKKTTSVYPIKPRFLVVSCYQTSQDTQQHIPIMNCIFSAQKAAIPIDIVALGNEDSTFLQQAAYITQGIYIRPDSTDTLFQQLLSLFVIDRHNRQFFKMPHSLQEVDFRAACFCHKRIIDVGLVCSVCLSISCHEISSCRTCHAQFSSS